MIKDRSPSDQYSTFHDTYWPAERLALIGDHAGAAQLLKQDSLLEENFLQISVLLNHDVIINTHIDAVSSETLMGTMGGILNLWIGITFVTLTEIVDFCLGIILDKMSRKVCQSVDKKTKCDCDAKKPAVPAPEDTANNNGET